MRELDAWIAEHVFVWQYKMTGSDPVEDGECWFSESGKFPCELPYYTTDPAAAMVVLEKCTQKDSVGIWRVSHIEFVVKNHRESVRATSETLPLAICLFAKQLFTK